MTRLTLRSGHDGRVLARILDYRGEVFVTDRGDRRWILDAASRAATGGFTVGWEGQDHRAAAGDPSLLRWLAHHYAGQGLLVFVDEPTVARPGAEDEPRIDTFSENTEFLSAAERASNLSRPVGVPVLRSEEMTTQRFPGPRR